MRELSYPGHVVPKLSVDSHTLPADTLALLDRKHLAHPSSLLAKVYWDVVEILTDMLDLMTGAGLGSPLTDPKHQAILRHAELLMLRCMSLHEYLGELLTTCVPASAKHELGACRRALDRRFGHDIRVPLNKVKHNGFTLTPITMTNPVAMVPGFVVYGPLGDGVAGPLSFSKKHGAGTREGYSLPLFMRRAFALIFELTDLALEPLAQWGAINSGPDTWKAHNPDNARIGSLPGVLDRLNALPRHGFMMEHETPSPAFDLRQNSLFMKLSRTKKLRGGCSPASADPGDPSGRGYPDALLGRRPLEAQALTWWDVLRRAGAPSDGRCADPPHQPCLQRLHGSCCFCWIRPTAGFGSTCSRRSSSSIKAGQLAP